MAGREFHTSTQFVDLLCRVRFWSNCANDCSSTEILARLGLGVETGEPFDAIPTGLMVHDMS